MMKLMLRVRALKDKNPWQNKDEIQKLASELATANLGNLLNEIVSSDLLQLQVDHNDKDVSRKHANTLREKLKEIQEIQADLKILWKQYYLLVTPNSIPLVNQFPEQYQQCLDRLSSIESKLTEKCNTAEKSLQSPHTSLINRDVKRPPEKPYPRNAVIIRIFDETPRRMLGIATGGHISIEVLHEGRSDYISLVTNGELLTPADKTILDNAARASHIPTPSIKKGFFQAKEDEVTPQAKCREVVIDCTGTDGLDTKKMSEFAQELLATFSEANPYPYSFYGGNCSNLVVEILEQGGPEKFGIKIPTFTPMKIATPKETFKACVKINAELLQKQEAYGKQLQIGSRILGMLQCVVQRFAMHHDACMTNYLENKSSQATVPAADDLKKSLDQTTDITEILLLIQTVFMGLTQQFEHPTDTALIIKMNDIVNVCCLKLAVLRTERDSELLKLSYESLINLRNFTLVSYVYTELKAAKDKADHMIRLFMVDANKYPQDFISNGNHKDADILFAEDDDEKRNILQEYRSQLRQDKNLFDQISDVYNLVNYALKPESFALENSKKSLHTQAERLRRVILKINELQKANRSTELSNLCGEIIKMLRKQLGFVNQQLYFKLHHSNNRNDKANVFIRIQDALISIPASQKNYGSVDDLLDDARKNFRENPAAIFNKVSPEELKSTAKMSKKPSVWDVSQWGKRHQLFEIDTRNEIAEILEAKKISTFAKLDDIRNLVAKRKPSWLQFWRKEESLRYEEYAVKATIYCLTEAFINGEIDERNFILNLNVYQEKNPKFAPQFEKMIESLKCAYKINVDANQGSMARETYLRLSKLLQSKRTDSKPVEVDQFREELHNLAVIELQTVKTLSVDKVVETTALPQNSGSFGR